MTVADALYFTLGVPLAGLVVMECCRTTICQSITMLERRWSLSSVFSKIQTESCLFFFTLVPNSEMHFLVSNLLYSSNKLGLVAENVISSCEK